MEKYHITIAKEGESPFETEAEGYFLYAVTNRTEHEAEQMKDVRGVCNVKNMDNDELVELMTNTENPLFMALAISLARLSLPTLLKLWRLGRKTGLAKMKIIPKE